MFEFQYQRRKQPSAVKMLLMLNIALFLIDWLILQPSMGLVTVTDGVRRGLIHKSTFLLGFVPRAVFEGGYVWQVITHMFMHGGLWHIFFNMLVLFMFGPHLERNLGTARFVIFYLLCGLAAMGLQTAIKYDTVIPMVGASGAIMGIVAGFGYLFPNSTLLVMGIIPVKAWKLVLFYAIFEFFQMVGNPGSTIANAAHFGGLVMGLLFLQIVYNKYPIFDRRRKRRPAARQAEPFTRQEKKDPWGTVIDLNRDDDGTWK